MSHNPQAPAVYSLCDELGLLVMDKGKGEGEAALKFTSPLLKSAN